MRDPRVVRLGELIVSYSLGLSPGQILRVDVPPVAAPLAVELYRAALAAGGHPYANVELEELEEILVKKGNDDQLEFLSPIAASEIEFVDAIVTVWAESNTRALSGVPPDRHQRLIASTRKLSKRRWERIAAGEMRWCGVALPDRGARAGRARCRSRSTSTSSSGPVTSRTRTTRVGHWSDVASELVRRAAERSARSASSASSGRTPISGSASPAGPGSRPTGGSTCPTARSSRARSRRVTEGDIRFHVPRDLPRAARSRTCGCASRAARSSRPRPRAATTTWRRSSTSTRAPAVLGEVAFGLNYEIDRFTRNILFDEKIGGTMHFALGSAFEQSRRQEPLGPSLGHDLRPPRRGRGLRRRRARLEGRAASSSSAVGATCLSSRARAAGRRPRRLLDRSQARRARPDRGLRRRRAPRRASSTAACSTAGGHPDDPHRCSTRVGRRCSREGTDEQLDWVNPRAVDDIERADVRIVDRRRRRTPARSRASTLRRQATVRALAPASLRDRYLERARRGRAALGARRLPDECRRAGRRDVARRLRGLRLRRGVSRPRRPGRGWRGFARAAACASREFLAGKSGAADRRGRTRT